MLPSSSEVENGNFKVLIIFCRKKQQRRKVGKKQQRRKVGKKQQRRKVGNRKGDR
jgi:hypothetical protein